MLGPHLACLLWGKQQGLSSTLVLYLRSALELHLACQAKHNRFKSLCLVSMLGLTAYQPHLPSHSSMLLEKKSCHRSRNLVDGKEECVATLIAVTSRTTAMLPPLYAPSQLLDLWRALFLTYNAHPSFPQLFFCLFVCFGGGSARVFCLLIKI